MHNRVFLIEDSSKSSLGGGQRISLFMIAYIKQYLVSLVIVNRGSLGLFNAYATKDTSGCSVLPSTSLINCGSGLFKYVISISRIFITMNATIYSTTRLATFICGVCRILLFWRKQLRWVAHEHMNPTSNVFFNFIYGFLLSRADTILVPSKYTLTLYKKSSPFLNEKYLHCFGAHAAYNIQYAGRHDKDVSTIISRNNSFRCINMLYSGKICDEKGLFKLIDMFNQSMLCYEGNISGHSELFHLYIAGSGTTSDMARLTTIMSGSSSITYLGMIDISKRFYSYFDIGIFPSWYVNESLGLSAIEMKLYIGRVLLGPCTSLKSLHSYPGCNLLLDTDDLAKSALKLYKKEPDYTLPPDIFSDDSNVDLSGIFGLNQ